MYFLSHKKRRQEIITVLKTIIAVSAMIIILRRIELNVFKDTLASIRLVYLFPLTILYFINIYVSAFRWRSILGAFNQTVPISKLLKMYLMGNFYNSFLPSSIGGDATKYIKLRKMIPPTKLASSMILERGYGIIVGTILSVIAYFGWGTDRVQNDFLHTIEIFLGIIVLFGFIALSARSQFVKQLNILHSRMSLRVVKKIIHTQIVLLTFIPKTYPAALHSLLFVLIGVIGHMCSFAAFNIPVSAWSIIIFVPLINLISLIPVSINALGIKEGAYTYFFGMVGINPAQATLIALFNRTLLYLYSLVGALFI